MELSIIDYDTAIIAAYARPNQHIVFTLAVHGQVNVRVLTMMKPCKKERKAVLQEFLS